MKYSSMKISVVSALGLGLALAVVWLVCGWPTPVAGADVGQVEVLASQVRYVAPSGVNKGDCNVPDSACQTVQYAMDRATEGDEIRVAAGTYTDIHTAVLESWRVITQVVYIRKSVSIQGGYTTANWEEPSPATNLTVLDAGGQGRVFYVDEDAQPTIEGLCITGGDATGLGGGPVGEEDVGGGIYVTADNVAIRNNQVFGNSAVYGGGVYVGYGAVTISGNTVTSNTAQQGGGVYLDESNSPVTGNTFVSNHADYGGGLFLSKSGATLGYNTVVSNAAGIRGGGLLLWRSDAAELNGNTVMSNTADYGGGVYMDESSATLVNNVVADNQAMTAGSGVYISGSDPNLLHTTIARNSGGDGSGVHVAEYVAEGGSVTLSDVEMAHTILVGHEVGIVATAGNTATLDITLWGNGGWANTDDTGGAGLVIIGRTNYWEDPDFVAPDAGDFHIGIVSAALDKVGYIGVTSDIDGDPRPQGHAFDLGADETGLTVDKQANPWLVSPGAELNYTIRVTNTSVVPLIATITDILPDHVTPGGSLTLGPVTIQPGAVHVETVRVTVDVGYTGGLTNVVQVTTDKGASGECVETSLAGYRIYMPLVLRRSWRLGG